MKERIFNLFLHILIFIAILSTILIIPLDDTDELWNYNFARNIANGLVPYRDFNIIVTPLLSFICGIILKMTCDQLIIMRILAAILCSVIFYITYKLFKLLDIKKELAFIFTFLIVFLFKDILCIDYNYASLLITLVIIYIEIKFYKKDFNFIKSNIKIDLILGLLGGLAFITKQTSGLFICLFLLGNKLLFIRKDELNVFFKVFVYRLIGILFPVILLLVYLISNNALEDFISYTILGIFEFSNSMPYKMLVKNDFIGVLSVVIPIMFLFTYIKTIILEKNKCEYIFLIYGLAIFTVCFPISNKIHFLIGSLPIIIIMFYEIYNLIRILKNKLLKQHKIIKIILDYLFYMCILILIYYSLINLYKYFEMNKNYCKLNHFAYITIDKEIEKKINNVIRYLKNNDNIKILDNRAAAFMIPIDRYNKYYDMFNNGNFGYNGSNKVIQEISESLNTKYLILKKGYNNHYQRPLEIIDYVKKNKTKTGEIEIFDIYE